MADFDRPWVEEVAALEASAGVPAEARVDSNRARFQSLITKSGDQMTINPSGPENLDKDPEYYNVLGEAVSRDQLLALEGGKQYADLERASRTGRRGFWEASLDFKAADIPFVGDVVGVAIPIREMKKVQDTLTKLKRGDWVPTQDKLYARLYLADAERKAQQGFMGKLGDVVHGLPTLGAEMWLTSAAFSAAAAPFAGGAAATGVGAPVGGLTEASAALSGAVVGLGRGLFKAGARQAAMKAAGKAAADWAKAGVKKSYLDFVPKAVGESATELGWGGAALRGIGELAVTAPIKGAGYAGMDLLANAAYNTATGEDALQTRSELDKIIAGGLDNNPELTDKARRLALGEKFFEYYTEMAGAGLGELLGLPVKAVAKAGYKYVPAMEKYKKTLEATWGTPAELSERLARFEAMPRLEREKAITSMGLWGLRTMVNNNINPSKVAKILKDTTYDGWIGEMAEERYGGFLNGLYGTDDGHGSLAKAMEQMWPDKDQLWAEAIGFAIPIATLHATARAQQLKAFGGSGLSNWAEGARAIQEVTGVSGTGIKVDVYGKPAAAEAPVEVAVEAPAGEAPAAPQAPNRDPTRNPDLPPAKNAMDKAVNFLMTVAENERLNANNKYSFLQRLARGALRIANVAVSGDFSRAQSGDSASRYLLDYGITTPFGELLARYEREETDDVRDRLVAKLTEKGATPTAKDIENNEALDPERIMLSKEVQDRKREKAAQLLSAVAAMNGRISLRHSDVATAAKNAKMTPEELEANINREVKEGRIKVLNHGDGNRTILRMTEDGEPAIDAMTKNMNQAMDEVLGPTRSHLAISTNFLSGGRTLDDVLNGVELDPVMLEDTPAGQDALLKLAIRLGQPVSELDALREYVTLASELRKGDHGSHVYNTGAGRVWARQGADGKYRILPVSEKDEDVKAAAGVGKALENQPLSTTQELEAALSFAGLSPARVNPKLKFIRKTLLYNKDPVALVHTLGYNPTEFGDEAMGVYVTQRTLAEAGNSEARAYVQSKQNAAKESLAKQYGASVKDITSKIGEDTVYSFGIGATNLAGVVYATVPDTLTGRASRTSIVEDVLEDRMKNRYGNRFHQYQKDYLSKLNALASTLAMEYKGKNDKLHKELTAISDLLLASVTGSEISYDALSKPIVMFLGHFDSSTARGQRVLQAAGWTVLRQAVMKDHGTKDTPGMRELSAGFLDRILQDVGVIRGAENFNAINQAYLPKNAVGGFTLGKGEKSAFTDTKLDPLRDLHELESYRQSGTSALDNIRKMYEGKTQEVMASPNTGPEAAQAAIREEEAARAEATKQRAADDTDVVSLKDAGFPTQNDFDVSFLREKIADETEEEYLRRKYCMGRKPGGPSARKRGSGK